MVKAGPRHQSGFTYILVLVAVAVLGISLAAIGEVWHTAQKREKERQLLFIGNQFRQAIALYYQRTPGPAKQYPKSLDDLLADKRYPNAPRYLRKVFYDPMTKTQDWGLIKAPDGGIMGVHSMSDAQPVKRDGFAERDTELAGKSKYYEWNFVYKDESITGKNQVLH